MHLGDDQFAELCRLCSFEFVGGQHLAFWDFERVLIIVNKVAKVGENFNQRLLGVLAELSYFLCLGVFVF